LVQKDSVSKENHRKQGNAGVELIVSPISLHL